MILQSRGLVRSRDKLNTLYLHLHWTNGHQTWQAEDLRLDASTLWASDNVRARDRLKILNLHDHNDYRHQTCHGGHISKEVLTQKVTSQQTFVGLEDVFKTCLEEVFNTSSA